MVTRQQAEVIRVAVPEARQKRLALLIKLCQRLGGNPGLPTQFLAGKHRWCVAAAKSHGFGTPTASPDGCSAGAFEWFSFKQPITRQQAALETNKGDQLRQGDDSVQRPAGLLQCLQMLRVGAGGFERQPFGVIERCLQMRARLNAPLLLQQGAVVCSKQLVRMPFADALRELQPLRDGEIAGISGGEQRQIAGLNRICRRLSGSSGLSQCRIGGDLCQLSQQIFREQCCSHTFSSA